MIAKDSKLIISVLSILGEQGLAGLGADLQCFGPKMSKEDSTVYNLKVFNSRQIELAFVLCIFDALVNQRYFYFFL